jgi:hypothetical protein
LFCAYNSVLIKSKTKNNGNDQTKQYMEISLEKAASAMAEEGDGN